MGHPARSLSSDLSSRVERSGAEGSAVPAFRLPTRRLLVAEYLAVADVDDAVRVFGDVVLVRDQDNRVALLVQAIEERHDLQAGLRVEVAGRLVGQNDRRVVHQSASDRHTLPLAA